MAMAHPLEVIADLQLAVEGATIDVQADGQQIAVDVPSLQVGRRLLATAPLARWDEAQSTKRAHNYLREVGLTLEVQVQGVPVAAIGADAQPGRIGRLLRLDGIEVRPTRAFRGLVRERPLLTTAVLVGLLMFMGWLVSRFGGEQ